LDARLPQIKGRLLDPLKEAIDVILAKHDLVLYIEYLERNWGSPSFFPVNGETRCAVWFSK